MHTKLIMGVTYHHNRSYSLIVIVLRQQKIYIILCEVCTIALTVVRINY